MRPDPRHLALATDYLDTFSSEAGQRVLRDLRASYANRSSHTPGDPYETAFREGERHVVLVIDRWILGGLRPEILHQVEDADDPAELPINETESP